MALPARTFEKERIITATEFEQMPEFNERYELIEGRLVEKPMPGTQHGRIIDKIKKALWKFDPDEKLGLMLNDTSTRLAPKNVPLPDASFWTVRHVPDFEEEGAAPRPDLVIEVLSPRDLQGPKRRSEVEAKIRRYQAAGVLLIWIINPKEKYIQVYQPGELEPIQTLKSDDILDGGEVISGFKLKVNELF